MRGRERLRGAQLHPDVSAKESKEEEEVPDVRPDTTEGQGGEGEAPPVLAILVSDIHLRHTCPISRGEKNTWYEAMEKQLGQLLELRTKHQAPIVCAGDVFHKWNSCPEIINFALLKLPPMFAIPGQHDLPYHDYGSVKKSAYWTLVQAGRITDLKPDKPVTVGNLTLHGFPWGFPLTTLKAKKQGNIDIAVVHRYLWREGHSYPNAPEELRLSNTLPHLKNYDAAVFGDNHSGFTKGKVINTGTFMRNKSDEKDYQPRVGLFLADGTIQEHFLDCKKDKWEEDVLKVLAEAPNSNLEEFMELLAESGDIVLDFGEILRRDLLNRKVPKEVREIILKSLEGK